MNPNLIEDVLHLLADMADYREDILEELEESEQEIVLDALREVGQSAALAQNEADLIALYDTIYRIAAATEALKEFLPRQVDEKPQAKGVDDEVAEEAEKRGIKSEHIRQHADYIHNNLYVFVTDSPPGPAQVTPSSPSGESLGSRLLQILRRFKSRNSS